MPPPTHLATARLRLGPPVAADIPILLHLLNDPLIAEMTLSIPYPYTERDAIAWIHSVNERRQAGTAHVFALREADGPALIGVVGIHLHPVLGSAELGYWLGAPYRRRGYMREAVSAAIQFGFEHLEVVRIQAMHKHNNLASGNAMLANGMRREAELEEYVVKDGQPQTVVQYRILRREWAARKGE